MLSVETAEVGLVFQAIAASVIILAAEAVTLVTLPNLALVILSTSPLRAVTLAAH